MLLYASLYIVLVREEEFIRKYERSEIKCENSDFTRKIGAYCNIRISKTALRCLSASTFTNRTRCQWAAFLTV